MKENEDVEKEAIDIKFSRQKTNFENYEIAIDFRRSNVQEEDEENIA